MPRFKSSETHSTRHQWAHSNINRKSIENPKCSTSFAILLFLFLSPVAEFIPSSALPLHRPSAYPQKPEWQCGGGQKQNDNIVPGPWVWDSSGLAQCGDYQTTPCDGLRAVPKWASRSFNRIETRSLDTKALSTPANRGHDLDFGIHRVLWESPFDHRLRQERRSTPRNELTGNCMKR